MLVRGAVTVVGQWHALTRRAFARAGPTLQRIAVGVKPVLRQPAKKLVRQAEIALHHPENAHLRVHREIGADVSKQRPCGMGEIPPIGREALYRGLASSEHTLVI